MTTCTPPTRSSTCRTSSGASRRWPVTWRFSAAKQTSGGSDILRAIHDNDPALLTGLIAADPDLVRRPVRKNIRPLLLAAYYGRQGLIRVLLEHGAPLDVCAATVLGMAGDLSRALESDPRLVRKHSPDAWTLLHLAARFDQVETAHILLLRGCDPQARSSQGGLYPIHLASSAAMVRLLISHGAYVNARTKQQASLLHYAVMRDDPEFVALLVSLGADPQARTRAGQTPWAVAVRYGKRRAADSLLRGPL